MILIDLSESDGRPIYGRISDRIKFAIAGEVLRPGELAPSVRELSKQLVVNPNTVARAYKELEADRLVRTEGRNGTFVLASRSQVDDEETRAAAETFARAARRAGLSRAEAGRVLDEAW